MRLRVRLLGRDVLDLASGRDAADLDLEADTVAVTGPASADLTHAPAPFGLAGHDQQYTYPLDKREN